MLALMCNKPRLQCNIWPIVPASSRSLMTMFPCNPNYYGMFSVEISNAFNISYRVWTRTRSTPTLNVEKLWPIMVRPRFCS